MRTFALMQAIDITRLMMRIRSQEIAAHTDKYILIWGSRRERYSLLSLSSVALPNRDRLGHRSLNPFRLSCFEFCVGPFLLASRFSATPVREEWPQFLSNQTDLDYVPAQRVFTDFRDTL